MLPAHRWRASATLAGIFSLSDAALTGRPPAAAAAAAASSCSVPCPSGCQAAASAGVPGHTLRPETGCLPACRAAASAEPQPPRRLLAPAAAPAAAAPVCSCSSTNRLIMLKGSPPASAATSAASRSASGSTGGDGWPLPAAPVVAEAACASAVAGMFSGLTGPVPPTHGVLLVAAGCSGSWPASCCCCTPAAMHSGRDPAGRDSLASSCARACSRAPRVSPSSAGWPAMPAAWRAAVVGRATWFCCTFKLHRLTCNWGQHSPDLQVRSIVQPKAH